MNFLLPKLMQAKNNLFPESTTKYKYQSKKLFVLQFSLLVIELTFSVGVSCLLIQMNHKKNEIHIGSSPNEKYFMIMSEDMLFIRLFVLKNIINVRVLYVHVSNQVVATVDETNPLDQVVPPRQDGLSHDLAAYISCKTSKLALPNDGIQVRCLKF